MPVFVDSNVLIYARDLSEPTKSEAARAWLAHLWGTGTGRLSYQVLQEFYAVACRKLATRLDDDAARQDVLDLMAWHPLAIGAEEVRAAWGVRDRAGISYWDAAIVAAAQALGCELLLTEDLHEGQDFDGTIIVNPFRTRPPGTSTP